MGKVENQNTSKHVVFLGESGFPKGLATIQRLTLMAKALLSVGSKTTVICRKGVWKESDGFKFDKQGNFEGIDYIYTSKSTFRPEGFIDRNRQKLKGIFGEFKHLRYLKKHDKIDLAIISDMKVVHVLRYYLYSIFLNFPITINFVEMTSSMQHKKSFLKKVNDYVHDKWVIKLFDGALPISDKLMDYYTLISPSKPRLKLPIVCDFEKFEIPKKKVEPYFLYCGSFRYTEVRDFIIEAYKNITDASNAKLYMIISGGSQKETSLLETELNGLFDTQRIKLFSNIPYVELVHLYTNAMAMLIPLRPTIQDASRFPHKIGEYLASGNPVITTDVGEIKNYFEDGKTALIAETYTIKAFTEKMKYVLDNPELSDEIGMNGKEMGLKEFDFKAHGNRLLKFVEEL
ncbi:MAG: glycosyltransferase [Maribacter sp.]